MATIYKIYCKNSEIKDLYVGSTISLKTRINEHRYSCNNENSKEYNKKAYKFIRENGGFDNFIIEKIIECDLENQYDKEVEYYLLLNSTLNSNYPKRSSKQYIIDNKKKISERHKQYIINNKEKIAELHKLYRVCNKKKIAENHKLYYAVNRDKILDQGKIKMQCDCGTIVTKTHMSRHNKSKKHQNYLSTI